jgi:hypothetical protein
VLLLTVINIQGQIFSEKGIGVWRDMQYMNNYICSGIVTFRSNMSPI